MRRKLTSFVLAVLLALATASVAAAGNGGFAPVAPASPNAVHIRRAYFLILGFTAAIFILVETLLIVFVVKYRSRGRDRAVEGAQVHGHSRLELIWTVFPVVILAIIAGFVFYELPNIDSAPAAANPIQITVEGHQYYWQFDYPNGARSIETLHVPTDAVVDLKVVSPDVIHSWWIPALGGKIQAIPGRTNHTWFQATQQGSFAGQCAELCGAFHASMLASVQSQSQLAVSALPRDLAEDDRQADLERRLRNLPRQPRPGRLRPADRDQHAADPAGLRSRQSSTTASPARPGAMPPVGDTWSQAEFNALAAYVKKNIYKPAPPGGTSGG